MIQLDPIMLVAIPLQAWTLKKVVELNATVASLTQQIKDLPCLNNHLPCHADKPGAMSGSLSSRAFPSQSPDAP